MTIKFTAPPPESLILSRQAESWLQSVFRGRFLDVRTKRIHGYALSTDPDDPPANGFVLWQSDGTGSGADGDIMVKITDSGGTTKTATLIDYSGV